MDECKIWINLGKGIDLSKKICIIIIKGGGDCILI